MNTATLRDPKTFKRAFYSREELEAMPLSRLKLIDISNREEEALVQSVVTDKEQAMPVTDELWRGDVPDIMNPAQEKEWQKKMDARAAAIRGLGVTGGGEDPTDPDFEKHNPGVEKPGPATAPTDVPPADLPPANEPTPPVVPPATDTPPGAPTETPPADPSATPPANPPAAEKKPFCAFCDSRGGFHKANCATKKVG